MCQCTAYTFEFWFVFVVFHPWCINNCDWLDLQEEIRNQISALETELKSETDKSISALVRVEKYRKERSEMDRKLDTQYQRKM